MQLSRRASRSGLFSSRRSSEAQRQEQHSIVRLCYYHSVPEQLSSDHKPVVAGFEVQLPGAEQPQPQLPGAEQPQVQLQQSGQEPLQRCGGEASAGGQEGATQQQHLQPGAAALRPDSPVAAEQDRLQEGLQEGLQVAAVQAAPPGAVQQPVIKVALGPAAAAPAAGSGGTSSKHRDRCVLQ
jgi:hypothetical protein